ncbi:MAG TPA: transglycosylase domain-containing protein [Candidatus Peribacteraceae bacterium]|nr:transglycosylase domain-containing protein [Candidatus Peribacteraceae bacterium]
MDFQDPPHGQNGFQSRSLNGQEHAPSADRKQFSVPRPPVRPSATPRMRSRRSRVPAAERWQRFRAWMHARGRKRLIRDGVIAIVVIGFVYFGYLWITLPNINDPRNLTAAQSSVILDRNGTELYRLYNEQDRVNTPDADIPDDLKHALVAIEDSRYYDRGCIDWRAIGRAVFRLGQGGGASTLTRQLARNALDLEHENILNRKIQEMILGCQLESKYSKDQLIDMYLNWIPFGKNAYGVGLAAKTYFNKDVKDLTLPEDAILASLPQAPSYFDPYGNHVHTRVDPQTLKKINDGQITSADQVGDIHFAIGLIGAKIGSGSSAIYMGGRTDQVLKNMQDLGYITDSQRTQALSELQTMTFAPQNQNIRAPYFVLWIKNQVQQMLGESADSDILDQGGLTIQTTLDWNMQQAAEQAINAKKDDIARLYNAHNIALLSVQAGTNQILAYVGNTGYNDTASGSKIDMVQVPRQPGSSFKPFVYGDAFQKGYSPSTVLYDVPIKIGTDQPQDDDGKFWGMTTIRKALAGSRNIPAAQAFFLAGGEDDVLNYASRMGVTAPSDQKNEINSKRTGTGSFDYGWPLAIGAAEVPLYQMVDGYATYANGGIQKPLVAITQIKDRHGNILYQAPDNPGVRAIDARIAYLVTSVLSDVQARPNAYWQNVLSVPGFQAAAKTGTSDKCLSRDATGNCTNRKPLDLWTMGYTPDIVTGIWVGNADSSPLGSKGESLTSASPIWKDYMMHAEKILKNAKTGFDVPPGIVQPQISTLSGQLPTACTPINDRTSDYFLQEDAPTQQDPACVQLNVDKVTGLLASDQCPASAAEQRSFFQPQSVLADRFPDWQNATITWAQDQMKGYDPVTNTLASGSLLPLPLAPTQPCSTANSPGRNIKPSVTLTFPTNGGAVPYPAFKPTYTYSSGSPLREVDISIDGKQVGTSTTAPFDVVAHVPRSIQESGTHTVTITITDQYYNTATDQSTVTFGGATAGPSVQFTQPSSPVTLKSGDTLTMSADASAQAGIKYVEFYLNGQLLTTKPKEPYSLSYKVTLPPGTYTLKAVATDFSNKTSEDDIEVTVTQ